MQGVLGPRPGAGGPAAAPGAAGRGHRAEARRQRGGLGGGGGHGPHPRHRQRRPGPQHHAAVGPHLDSAAGVDGDGCQGGGGAAQLHPRPGVLLPVHRQERGGPLQQGRGRLHITAGGNAVNVTLERVSTHSKDNISTVKYFNLNTHRLFSVLP